MHERNQRTRGKPPTTSSHLQRFTCLKQGFNPYIWPGIETQQAANANTETRSEYINLIYLTRVTNSKIAI